MQEEIAMQKSGLTAEQIQKGVELLSRIRTDEGDVLLECINGDTEYYIIRFFDDTQNKGIFLSLLYWGHYRIFIAFENDTNKYITELVELIQLTKEKGPNKSPTVLFIAEQQKLISEMRKALNFKADYYASHEFVMDKKHFKGFVNDKQLEVRLYEAEKIGDYAWLLDKAMTFLSPSPNFKGDTVGLSKEVERVKENAFYTFYIDSRLVGLYWLDNDFYTICFLAVAPEYQRQGYGSMILSHAINDIFTVQKHDMAKLYCVDWNLKGLSFYKKYGMILKGHTYSMILE